MQDRPEGILAMGDYARCAHGNLATVRGDRLVVVAYVNAKAVALLRGEAEEDWEAAADESDAPPLCEYELQRLAKIAENNDKLRGLGLLV